MEWSAYVSEWRELCESNGLRYGLDPWVVATLISIESSGNASAVSSAGAWGCHENVMVLASFCGCDGGKGDILLLRI